MTVSDPVNGPGDLKAAARLLIEYMPGATAIFDREMRYVAVTDDWLREYGIRDRAVIGECHYDVFPEMPERWRALHRRCFDGESLQAEDDAFVGADGRAQRIDWQMRPWRDAAGAVAGIVLISRKVTQNHVAAEALRMSEARLSSVFAAMSEGLVIHGADGRIVDLNRAAETLLGLTRDQILGRTSMDPRWRAVHEDGSDYPGDEHPAMVTLRTGLPQHHRIMGVQTGDGETRWLSVNSEPLPTSDDPSAGAAVATFADVTRERNDFDRIRALAQRLETAREDERRAAAHSLHEGIAQELYAARLAVSRLGAKSAGSIDVANACELIERRLEKCLTDMRQVANDLRPSSLALLRVAEALNAHAKYFGPLAGLDIQILEMGSFPTLNEPTRMLLFRIAQEALTNISKHAAATSVTVTLASNESGLLMDIEDDGCGISDEAASKPGSLGLLGIRERMHARHGTFRIQRNLGRPGTTLSVGLPLEGAVAHPRVPVQTTTDDEKADAHD
jgi:PAS domain S-box-containing protein